MEDYSTWPLPRLVEGIKTRDQYINKLEDDRERVFGFVQNIVRNKANCADSFTTAQATALSRSIDELGAFFDLEPIVKTEEGTDDV